MTSGKLIVFEGVDASGKTSLSTLFLGWLQERGVDAELKAFPGRISGTIGELVYRLHHDSSSFGVTQITPLCLQALHIAAHLDAIEAQIIPSLQSGKTVVLDRYWWSTIVYGVTSGGKLELLEKLVEAEKLAWGKWLPKPLFYITRSDPLRDEPRDKWEAWKSSYEEIVRKEASHHPIHFVENNGTLEEAFNEVTLSYASQV